MSYGERATNELMLGCVQQLRGRRGLLVVEKAPDGRVTDQRLIDDRRVAAVETLAREKGRPTTAILVPSGTEVAVTAIVASYNQATHLPIMQDNPGQDLPHVWLCPIDKSILN